MVVVGEHAGAAAVDMHATENAATDWIVLYSNAKRNTAAVEMHHEESNAKTTMNCWCNNCREE